MLLAFCLESPQRLLDGMVTILISLSQLFTGLYAGASVGSTLIECNNMLLIIFIVIRNYLEIPDNRTVIGEFGILARFSFFREKPF